MKTENIEKNNAVEPNDKLSASCGEKLDDIKRGLIQCEVFAINLSEGPPSLQQSFKHPPDTPNTKFLDEIGMQEQKKIQRKLKMFKCYFCEYRTLYKTSLDRHVNGIHLNLREHKCHLCDFSSTRKYDLKRHVENVHLNLRAHECHLCKLSFNRKYGLRKHLEKVHSKDQSNCVEKIEEQIVKQEPEMDSQLQSEVEKRIYVEKKVKGAVKPQHECKFCDYNSRDKASMRKHVEGVHLNLRSHKCTFCEYTSNQKGTLNNHIKAIHLNLKTHKCTFCQYSSNHKNVLRMHLSQKHNFFEN